MTKPMTKRMSPWRPYVGQREQMKELAIQRGTTIAQITRDAVAAYIKKELKR